MINRRKLLALGTAGVLSGLPRRAEALRAHETFFRMPNWAAGKAAVAAGTRNAKLAIIGDSTTAGFGANSDRWAGAQSLAFPTALASLISNASIQSWFGDQGTNTNAWWMAYDARVSETENWRLYSQGIGGGLHGEVSPFTDTLSFTPTKQVDTFIIYYSQASANGTFTWNINGGSDTSINSGGTPTQIKTTTATGTLGSNTLNIQRSSGGSVYIIGVIACNSAVKEISILNFGIGAVNIAALASNAVPWGTYQMIGTLAPDLSIIDCTINDWAAGTDVATFTANTQSLITKCKSVGDVLLVTGNPISTAVTSIAQQQLYISAYLALGSANSVNVINMTQRLGSYAAANTNGWMLNIIHPNRAGYTQIARIIAGLLA
jgi:lysophospholipase L1-like esterase